MRGVPNVFDGEMHGRNISIDEVADALGLFIQMPVLDKTGITGEYDFSVEPFAPGNESGAFAAVGAFRRLGLRLRRVKGDVQTIVIDNIERPTPN